MPCQLICATRTALHGDTPQSDWLFDAGLLAPAMYIFFASVIPALTFGEQFADETDNEFGGAQVLGATAICGLIQSIFGGQPMLIVGYETLHPTGI